MLKIIYELLTTSSLLFISGGAYYFKNKPSSNDHEKIKTIADNLNLKTKEESIRIYRKKKHKNYTEYVYKMPLGLSSQQFKDNIQTFVDGLNNKSTHDFTIENLLNINFKSNPILQIKKLLNNKIKLDKQLEIEYDGMLKFRVYDQGLEKLYLYNDDLLQKNWIIPVGFTFKNMINHDFEKRPHMIVAGATGFGKSEYLKLIISTLTMQQPKNVRYHLIDLKGGNELGPFKDMEQCVSFSRDPIAAKKSLEDIQNKMNKKLEELFERGIKDVKAAGQKERDFVIIDEAADLDNDSRDIVVDIARRGRSAGYRLIYATQYPTNETLPSQVRANIGARVCFRLETNAQSRAVLDEGGAEKLPEIEGRAIFRRVKNQMVQTPLINEKQIKKIITPHIHIKGKEGLDAERKTDANFTVFEAI